MVYPSRVKLTMSGGVKHGDLKKLQLQMMQCRGLLMKIRKYIH